MMKNMNIKYVFSLWALSLLACGCTNQQDELEVPPTDGRIGVSACLATPVVSTRTAAEAVPYQGSTPSASNPLDASVWFSTESGTYVAGETLDALPRHTEVRFNSSGTVYPTGDVLMYPESDVVYCVGLYPYSATEWTNTDASGDNSNTHASHTIDGSQDLMFAPQISGSKASPISSALAFTHQLTWLKINVIAEDNRAISSWGNVTDITVTSPGNKLTVDLSAGTASCNSTPTYIKALENASTPLRITTQQLGSVFCAPATSYQVNVKTANETTGKDLTITLKNISGENLSGASDAKGKMFVITLNFKAISTIEATCTLTAWDDDYRTIEGS